jgi:hypothetical protein
VGGFERELHDRDRRDVTGFFPLSSFRNVHRSRTPISLENRFGDNIQDRILQKKKLNPIPLFRFFGFPQFGPLLASNAHQVLLPFKST